MTLISAFIMTINEIIAHTGIKSRTSIRRYMRERGFPKPIIKGRGHASRDIWNRTAVEDWWRENRNKVGRWPR